MYKSPFFIKIIYPCAVLIAVIIYYMYIKNIWYLILGVSFAIWFAYYLHNLRYIIRQGILIKRTGKIFKIEKRLKIDKIISFTHFNLEFLKLNILIIKHIEGRMFVLFLSKEDIRKIIRK